MVKKTPPKIEGMDRDAWWSKYAHEDSDTKMLTPKKKAPPLPKPRPKKKAPPLPKPRPAKGVLATRELLGELNTVLKKRNPNETITAKDLKKLDSDHSRWKKLLFAATPTEARKMKELMKKWKGK